MKAVHQLDCSQRIEFPRIEGRRVLIISGCKLHGQEEALASSLKWRISFVYVCYAVHLHCTSMAFAFFSIYTHTYLVVHSTFCISSPPLLSLSDHSDFLLLKHDFKDWGWINYYMY